jgi:cystathionine gamma-lyase
MESAGSANAGSLMRDATRVVNAGLLAAENGEPFLAGPVFAATFHARGNPADSAFTYGRDDNPTWQHFERALGELEGGAATIFPSGMAAMAAIFGAVLAPGDVLVMPDDGYYTGRTLTAQLSAFGIDVRGVSMNRWQPSDFDGARLIWIETPANPSLDVYDVAKIVAAAHGYGALVAMDNTTATILGQSPLALGADISMASDTKGLSGHSDLLMGHVAVRDPQLHEKLRRWRRVNGSIPGPMEVWLAHRSLATLELRISRQCDNALQIATFLAAHAAVRSVRYPGLPGDPAHAIAAKQMLRFGSIVGFTLADLATAERFLAGCRLVHEATSFGGVHTTAERRARWEGDAVAPGFVRLSAGCEDARDLIEDMAAALDGL